MTTGRSSRYILDGQQPIPCDDLLAWARCFGCRVGFDERSGVRVNTMFLGLDHNFFSGPPLLFETTVFGGHHDEETKRYSTWEEAEDGHRMMCVRVFGYGKQELSDDDIRAILSEARRLCCVGDGEDLLAVAIRLAYRQGREAGYQ